MAYRSFLCISDINAKSSRTAEKPINGSSFASSYSQRSPSASACRFLSSAISTRIVCAGIVHPCRGFPTHHRLHDSVPAEVSRHRTRARRAALPKRVRTSPKSRWPEPYGRSRRGKYNSATSQSSARCLLAIGSCALLEPADVDRLSH